MRPFHFVYIFTQLGIRSRSHLESSHLLIQSFHLSDRVHFAVVRVLLPIHELENREGLLLHLHPERKSIAVEIPDPRGWLQTYAPVLSLT